jgi:hypothetical protein
MNDPVCPARKERRPVRKKREITAKVITAAVI